MSKQMSVFDVNGSEYEIVDAEARRRLDILEQRGGGTSGGNDYDLLLNKPKIESVELVGNRTYSELGIAPMTTLEIFDIFNQVFGEDE